jgi:hypothetical protein
MLGPRGSVAIDARGGSKLVTAAAIEPRRLKSRHRKRDVGLRRQLLPHAVSLHRGGDGAVKVGPVHPSDLLDGHHRAPAIEIAAPKT